MLYPRITKRQLEDMYLNENLSMMQISQALNCSVHKVAYWMSEFGIDRRTRGQAIYIKHNPNGDPFNVRLPRTPEEYILFGLGLGLYWGEGTKASKNTVRLGNSDPGIISSFIVFLEKLYGVDRSSLKFGLQIFSDINPQTCLRYWSRILKIPQSQFYKPIVTISGSVGSYRVKNRYGVVTIYFGNTKLRNILVQEVANIVNRFSP